MAQDPKDSAGFTIPAPADSAASASVSASATSVSAATETTALTTISADTSSRDLLIGGGILLVLFIAFFFAKNAYANTLVVKRVPPNKANAAGWWLFIFLAGLSTGVVLAAVNAAKFMAPLIMGPIAVVSLLALVLSFTAGRK
ncbi:hypothetical protein GTP91_21775 [Rugamonas sp. FT82W]|uniref:Uncharacterized protein n=1 Tax=Duganella vulcania TaxID=2692166 RepID=A0A845GA88_9BURK|nr:hypothetical protein [Duganella vulcania]MYM89797.1 hypothetical protein [Duganella vulcania]